MNDCIGSQADYKKRKGICLLKFCTSRVHKSKTNTRRYCAKHQRQYEKEQNPVSYFFSVLKQNARRRNVKFELTVDEFRKFCEKTNYIALKGKGAGKMTIDRRDPREGYNYKNLRILEHGQNSRKRWIDEKLYGKGHVEFAHDYGNSKCFVETPDEDEESPF